MKNIWNKIKNFKYKWISALILLIASAGLSQLVNWNFLNYIMGASGLFLFGYVCIGGYHASKNTWNDGDTGSKVLAIVYSVVGLSFIGLLIYLFASK